MLDLTVLENSMTAMLKINWRYAVILKRNNTLGSNSNEAVCLVDWNESMEIGINVEKESEGKEEGNQRITEDGFSPTIF